ncbi:MAG TPA: DNA-formamidopyrimidine glycosylase family protein [Thermoanaerobaculia bacterium]|jgi:endonuclease-8
MPEGNTIHRLAREHTRDLANRIVRVSSPQGRFAKEARKLDRRRFRAGEAYGKHLFHHWERGLVVHVHLGMAGWFYRFDGTPPPPRPTVRMRLSTPSVTIDLIGPPTCELVSEPEREAIIARLGPDPLRKDADPELAWEKLRLRDRPIGDALLDQRVVAGAGNIYRNEALFLSGIHPLSRSKRLSRRKWEELWRTLQALMRHGARTGSIRTVDLSETPHPRAKRDRRDEFYVYRREICRRCGRRIRELPLSGRRMFVCPGCQRR